MSSRAPAKFERFFWGGGQDGEAYYIKHLTSLIPPVIAPLKSILTSAVGKFSIALNPCIGILCSAVTFGNIP